MAVPSPISSVFTTEEANRLSGSTARQCASVKRKLPSAWVTPNTSMKEPNSKVAVGTSTASAAIAPHRIVAGQRHGPRSTGGLAEDLPLTVVKVRELRKR